MIRHLLFDLDNTIYSAKYGIEKFLFKRVSEFVRSYLGLSSEEALKLQTEGFNRWGTSIKWLTSEMGFTDLDAYFAHLHPEDEADCLSPDPALREFLLNLPCPSSILTNSPAFHAERVLKKLELEGIFKNIFDIISNDFTGKPHPSSYNRALEKIGLNCSEVIFIDDLPAYVEGYIAIGGRGILLDEMNIHKDFKYDKITNLFELTGFLED